MNRPVDNVRVLVFPRISRALVFPAPAKIICLRSRRRPSRLARAITLSLGVIGVALATVASVLLLRSQSKIVGDLLPCWPWYWPPG